MVIRGNLWIIKDLMDITGMDVLILGITMGRNGSLWSSHKQQRLPRSRLLEGQHHVVFGTRGRTSRSGSGTLKIIIPKNHCVYHKLENFLESQG